MKNITRLASSEGWTTNMAQFKWTGVEQMAAKFKLLDKGVRSELLKAVDQSVEMMQVRAKQIITENNHVVTGNLRGSIKSEAKYVTLFLIQGEVGTAVHYAPYIESLPDGGYLFRAVKEELPSANIRLANAVKSVMGVAG